ncbi:hypothetical protein N0V93_001041 [Gnomoniopsis smithogilvyi]|uniref:C2H2-type domain-containing protein n=1 Tax=Gnomoniopsis smithogilvyi TaxID=1191159 RepID=A0A9W8Z1C0_9PEZI|nr:hypothetical protein N0V93_001041 [Gnomoniopsis smithogilvyi]
MSVAIAGPDAQCYQPFQCQVCQTRFTRHENLKRHAALHTGSREKPSFPCEFCPITFSRRDLRHRHIRRKHPEHEERRAPKRRRRNSTAATAETSADGSDAECSSSSKPASKPKLQPQPQQWDEELGLGMLSSGGWHPDWLNAQLIHDEHQQHHLGTVNLGLVESAVGGQEQPTAKDIEPTTGANVLEPGQHPLMGGSPASNPDSIVFNQGLPDGLSPSDLPYFQEEWYPTASQIAQGVDLFFTHVSHFVPFLHLPTFDPTQSAEHLVLAMLCLAYQHGEDPDAGNGPSTGDNLSQHCFHRARVLIASEGELEDSPADELALVQTYLLLEIAAMTYLCGKDSAYGLKVHSKMISLVRSSGLTQPRLSASTTAEDLDSLWRAFVKVESQKRTLFAVHQIDALWYQILSIPRSLSHLEIKHELPCPEDRWAASSASVWAHRELLRGHTLPPLQYADAVRRFLSSDAAVDTLPPFDSYGAINITQFLLSSAREVSGWSAMTGRLSLERLETLKASLVTLGTFVHPPEDGLSSSRTSSVEATATWEMAMIELRIWSSTHTGGVVQGSVDAALKQLTSVASSSEPSYGAETAQATRPYIDWFLRYLDDTIAPESESPWVALFAFKAFLIAWQLVRAEITGAMQVVGVKDGDVDGAIAWARDIFRRRERRRLGKIIVECLDLLVP